MADSASLSGGFTQLFRLLGVFALLYAFCGPVLAEREVSRASGNLMMGPSHGGDGSAWGKKQCGLCHVTSLIHANAPNIRNIVRVKGEKTCAGCHGSNGAGIKRQCLICHNARDLPARPILKGVSKHDFDLDKQKKLTDAQCVECHKGSDMDGRFVPEIDLTALLDRTGVARPTATITEFCLGCHNRDHQQARFPMQARPERLISDPLVAQEDNYTFFDEHGYLAGRSDRTYIGLRDESYQYGPAGVVECTDCHAMHGTHNDKLIIDTSRAGVSQLNPKLRLKPYPIDLKDGINSKGERMKSGNMAQLCVMCHQMKSIVEAGGEDTGNGLSGVHDVTSDCTECHSHGESVQVGL